MSDDIKLPELLSCPFCGSEAKLFQETRSHWSVGCKHCNATTGYELGREKAATAWNKRAAVELNRADTARLDWIADGGRVSFDRAISMWVAAGIDGTPYWADTMRKAIDNAISRYKSTPAPEHGEG